MQTKELPNGWLNKPLSDIATAITSGATPQSGSSRYYTRAGGIKFAKIDDLTAAEDRYIDETFLRVTPAAFSETALSLYPAGTLLLSMYGTIGLVKTTLSEMSANQALAALLPPFKCDPDYLAHVLIWSRPRWEQFKSQTTQANINGGIVKAFRVDIATTTEQRCIAEILDTLDEAIRKTELVIAKLQQIKQGLLHDLLTRGIDENGELRDPERHPEQFKDSPLGKIPKGWEVIALLALVSLPTGQHDPRVEPFRSRILVAPDHVESGTGRLLDTKIAASQGAISGKYGFEPGDVVYSKIRPYLRKAILADFVGLCSADMYPLRPSQELNPRFLLALILGERFSRFAEIVSMRSGFPKINRRELSEFSAAMPSRKEQDSIAEILVAFNNREMKEEEGLLKLRSLKQGLMDDLLTGRVRVTVQEGAAS